MRVIHAQHSLAALGALSGGPRPARRGHRARPLAGLLLVDADQPRCSSAIDCGFEPMTRCLTGRLRAPAPLSWAVIPYMRWDLAPEEGGPPSRRGGAGGQSRRSRASCARAGLQDVEVIPNIVDATEIDAHRRDALRSFLCPSASCSSSASSRRNKGAHLLVPAVAAAKTGLPLVVLGEGSLARTIKHEALTPRASRS